MRWIDPKSGSVMPVTQVCRVCRKEKAVAEFPWRKAAHDRKEGPLSRCYECDRDYRRSLKSRLFKSEFLPWTIYTPPVLAELRSHIEAGLTAEQIADKMGMAISSIRNARCNHCLPKFRRVPRESKEAKLIPSIAAMVRNGANYSQAGHALGKSKNAISGIVFRNRVAFNLAMSS